MHILNNRINRIGLVLLAMLSLILGGCGGGGGGGFTESPPATTTTEQPTNEVVTLNITTTDLPDGQVGQTYPPTQLQATNADSNSVLEWSVKTGEFPAGLQLSKSGLINGTPTTAKTYNFILEVKDTKNLVQPASQSYQVIIADLPTLTITTTDLPDGRVGQAYPPTQLQAGNADSNSVLEWSVKTGEFPAGLQLSKEGLINGTPTTAKTYGFILEVRDTKNLVKPATQSYQVIIADSPTLTITTTDLPDGRVGQAYPPTQLQAGNADSNSVLEWSVKTGEFPAGLQLSNSGLINGTPTTAKTYDFILEVRDTKNLVKPAGQLYQVIINPGPSQPVALGLGTSQVAIRSDNVESAQITATVLDANNAGINGVTVSFSADSGALSAASAVSDAKGDATVTFSSGSIDRSNRVATITATVGILSRPIPIQILGTTLQLTVDDTSLPSDGSETATLLFTLRDARPNAIFDTPVCINNRSSNGGSISILHFTTGTALTTPCPVAGVAGIFAGRTTTSGELRVRAKGGNPGQVILEAVAAGAPANANFDVQAIGDVFRITAPLPVPPAQFPPAQLINTGNYTVQVDAPNSSVVTFSTSLGSWSNGQPSHTIAVPQTGPQAGTVQDVLTSPIAGTANVQVQGGDTPFPSDSVLLLFTADLKDARLLRLVGTPASLPVSGGGVEYTSTLVATLLTQDGQPVAGVPVSFSLLPSTNGGAGSFISPPSATTDAEGKAIATFKSGSQASIGSGIPVQALVTGPGLPTPLTAVFNIVIREEATSVVIGRSTKISSINNDTAYSLPMSVLVSDINGSPVSGADVSLRIRPAFYSTGFRDTQGNCIITGTFPSEDENLDCELTPGANEDDNGNGDLEPTCQDGGTVPASVKADANGLATFDLIYLKQSACWVTTRVIASTLVSTATTTSELVFVLPELVEDARFLPPSPYGVGIPAATSMGITTDRITVKSDDSEEATIRVSVLANNNAGIPGVVVFFSTDTGEISSSSVTTDQQGNATIKFSSGIVDKSNRVATITAITGEQERTIPIRVVGTTINLDVDITSLPEPPPPAGQTLKTATATVTLLDAGNIAIFQAPVCFQQSTGGGQLRLEDAAGNELTEPCKIPNVGGLLGGTTDVNGKLTIKVKGQNDGQVKLIANGGGAQAETGFDIAAVGQALQIVNPVADAAPQLINDGVFVFQVQAPNTQVVFFSTSQGSWNDLTPAQDPVATIEVPVVNGVATAELRSAIAGTANVVVRDKANAARSDNRRVTFTADIADAASLTLQATSRLVPISVPGAQNTSTLIATLLTNDNQPVAGGNVSFTILKSTGGGEFISPPSVTTDTTGSARATFVSGTKSSDVDGVEIEARVVKPNTPPNPPQVLSSKFFITITNQAGSVTIGRSTTVESIAENTSYRLPMSVLVADVGGNRVSGAVVNLTVWPVFYSFGFRVSTPSPGIVITDTFPNEDVNEDLFKQATEDLNGDGRLTPANSTAGNLPRQVTTDSNGVATFSLIYLKEHANWITDRVRASAIVQGTEIVSELVFDLPTLAIEFTAVPPILPDSSFNSVCPFVATASPAVVEVPLGDSAPVKLELWQRCGPAATSPCLAPPTTPADVSQNPVGRPVQAFVSRATGAIGASNSLTIDAGAPGRGKKGQAISQVSAVYGDTVTDEGDTALVTYYVSCAETTVNAQVKAFTANILSNLPVDSPTAGDKTIKVGDSLSFTGMLKGRGGLRPYTYSWSFGGGGVPTTCVPQPVPPLTCSDVQNPGSVPFNVAGNYQVKFTIADSDNLSDFDIITVKVEP